MAVRWLTVNEAAEVLDVSAETIRRRAKRGMLDSRKAKRKGGRMEVRVPVSRSRAQTEAQPDQADDAPAAVTATAAEPPTQPPTKEQIEPQAAAGGGAGQPAEAAQWSAKMGRYSALPEAMGGRLQGRFTPSDLMKQGQAGGTEDELQRYQRLAGASVILAQRQADAANEQVVMARGEVHRLRRVCFLSWAVGAATVAACLLLALVLGVRSSRSTAELAIQQQRVTEARGEVQRLAQSLHLVQRQLQPEPAREPQSGEVLIPDIYATPYPSSAAVKPQGD